jgi:hypothetical protein
MASPLLKYVLQSNLSKRRDMSNSSEQALDAALETIHTELEFYKVDLDYKLVYNLDGVTNYDDEFLSQLTQFINEHYMKQNQYYQFYYTEDILRFFLNEDSIVIVFYPKGTQQWAGCIMGKRRDIVVNTDFNTVMEPVVTKSLEMNFLCGVGDYNRFSYTNYFMNILKLTSINLFGVAPTHFTKTKLIETKTPFCKRSYYHRPVCIDSLVSVQFLPDIYANNRVQRKIYSTFGYDSQFMKGKRIIYNHDYTSDTNIMHTDLNRVIEMIYTGLQEYSASYHDIYDIKSRQEIRSMILSESFHCFLIVDDNVSSSDESGTDFVSFYEMEFKNKLNGVVCRNAYYYTGFFRDLAAGRDTLEVIHDYMYKYTNISVTTIVDLFGYQDKDYALMKFLKSPGCLYYFIDHYDLKSDNKSGEGTIAPKENGIVPI